MAIESTFYDTSETVPASLVTEIKWAASHPDVGSSEYGVVGPGDFAVTAHPSLPFTLNVAAGKAWGHGVFDVSDAIEPVTCNAPGAGTTRWDLIALRRDWGPLAGGPTSLVAVEGGSVEGLPTDRENTPGDLDDQPLYLAEWVAGQTQPRTLVDIRCWAGNGGMFAKSKHVRSYLTRIGSRVQFGSTQLWTLEILANGVVDWTMKDITQAEAPVTSLGAGWKNVLANGHPPRVRRTGNMVQMIGGLQRTTGELSNILNVPAGFTPLNGSAQFVGAGVTSNGIAYELVLQNGKISIPDGYVTKLDTGVFVAYPLTASWTIT